MLISSRNAELVGEGVNEGSIAALSYSCFVFSPRGLLTGAWEGL